MKKMANQQLVDYIKQQLQLGVSKEAVKETLSQAGWPEADINDALSAAAPSPAEAAQSSSPATPSVPSTSATVATETKLATETKPAAETKSATKGESARGVQPAASASQDKPGATGPASSALSQLTNKSSASQSSPSVAKDILKPKSEAAFQPKIQTMSAQAAGQSSGDSSTRKYALPAVGIAVVLVLAGWSVYLFLQNRALKGEASQSADLSASLEEARTQIASLTNDKNMLSSQLEAVNLERNDLLLHLSFFVAPAGEAETKDITISGTLGGGGRSPYTITTSRQVVLNVKNSSESDVSKALQPLLGSVIEVVGTYVPGTRNITVAVVNGVPVTEATQTPPTAP